MRKHSLVLCFMFLLVLITVTSSLAYETGDLAGKWRNVSSGKATSSYNGNSFTWRSGWLQGKTWLRNVRKVTVNNRNNEFSCHRVLYYKDSGREGGEEIGIIMMTDRNTLKINFANGDNEIWKRQ